MQKVFNVFSTVAFLGVVTIGAGAGYVYVQREAIIDSVKEAAMEQVSGALPGLVVGALGGGIGGDVPDVGASLPGGSGDGDSSTLDLPVGLGF